MIVLYGRFQDQKDDMVGSASDAAAGGDVRAYGSGRRVSEDAKLCRRESPGCIRLRFDCSRLRAGNGAGTRGTQCFTKEKGQRKNN